MANRYGYEDEPGRWRARGTEDERGPETRRGGSYGIGGPERGYNMGGYGGMGSYEQGYTPRSYDRLLELTERRENERSWHERNWRGIPGGGGRYTAGAVGMGHEPFGDEWMNFDRARGQGKAPKGYTRSDARIREDVCERLMYSPYDASDIEVTVSNGEVTLSGVVHTRADKWGIEDVAESVLGVHDVHNQIRLVRSESQTSDVSTHDTRKLHS
jgi:osmotically-inducible protein OsmY